MIRFQVQEEAYHQHLIVCVGEDKDFSKYLKNKHGNDFPTDFSDADGRFLFVEDDKTGRKYRYLWLENMDFRVADYGLLVHEMNHYMFHCMRYVGIELSGASEEAYTYFVQRMYEKVLFGLMRAKGLTKKPKKK